MESFQPGNQCANVKRKVFPILMFSFWLLIFPLSTVQCHLFLTIGVLRLFFFSMRIIYLLQLMKFIISGRGRFYYAEASSHDVSSEHSGLGVAE